MSPLPAQHQRKPGIESKLEPRPRYQAPLYKGSGKLSQKVALITGGDSGIGRAVAVLFAREGADVAFTHLHQEQGDAAETQAAIEAEGRKALALRGDLRQPAFCRDVVKQTVKQFGKLDILVNNAAFQQHQESLDELSDEQLDRTFKTNIYAYFRVTKAALPHLQKGSAIVNTGSITGLEGSKGLLDYSATKGAIHAFTKSPGAESCREGHSRELCGARAGLDAAESLRSESAGCCSVWRRHAHETAGAAGRNRPRLRLLRFRGGFKLCNR